MQSSDIFISDLCSFNNTDTSKKFEWAIVAAKSSSWSLSASRLNLCDRINIDSLLLCFATERIHWLI